ncbi:MAG: hypothetical protein KDE32_05235 [Novosphingobium sp.]|nr:hypothetical protein [Novosphingobium sp.]
MPATRLCRPAATAVATSRFHPNRFRYCVLSGAPPDPQLVEWLAPAGNQSPAGLPS